MWNNARGTYLKEIQEHDLLKYMPQVNMPSRDKEIVQKYIDNVYTYASLGEEYGISRERIRQILNKYVKKATHYYKVDHGLIKKRSNET